METKAEKQKKDLLIAYKNSMGNVSIAVEKVGLSRTTFYNYVRDDEDFRNAVSDIEERNLDFAESQLLKQIREDNTTSLIFYLKTKGKSRGYVERQEFDVKRNKLDFSDMTTEELMQIVKEDE